MIARRRRNNSNSGNTTTGYTRYQNTGQTFVTSSPPQPTETLGGYIDSEMSCRDRTSEFASAVKSLQSRQNGVVTRQSAAVQQRSEFTQIAKYMDFTLFAII